MLLPAVAFSLALAMPLAAAGQSPLPAAPLSAADELLLRQRDELSLAIVKNDAKRVAAWIREHRQVNFNFDEVLRGRSSQSPLTLAVSRDFVDVAGVLLEAGAQVDRRDGFGRAAIHYARSLEAIELLVGRGVDLNAADARGDTALGIALERGDLAAADCLLRSGARVDAAGRNPDLLARAVETRHPELIPSLLDRGVDPRKPPTRAVWLLIESGDSPRALLLIRRGADPSAAFERGETLLARALFRRRWDVAEALIDAGANLRVPDQPGCAQNGVCQSRQLARLATENPALLGRLNAKGLDLDAVSADGHTALTSLIVEQPHAVRATRAGTAAGVAQSATTGQVTATTIPGRVPASEIPAPDNLARVKALLDAGADPNVRYRGALPLMLAMAMYGRPPEMADALWAAGGRIEYEATIVRGDPDISPVGSVPLAALTAREIPSREIALIGMSVGPLTWALQHRRPDIALRELERERRMTPADRHLLFFAAAAGHWALVLGALPYSREVDASNRADVTPLMMAASDGRADAVAALLAAGANVNARSVQSWPPLSDTNLAAAIAGHSPAPPRLAGGYTALRAARENGHADIVRMLRAAGARD